MGKISCLPFPFPGRCEVYNARITLFLVLGSTILGLACTLIKEGPIKDDNPNVRPLSPVYSICLIILFLFGGIWKIIL